MVTLYLVQPDTVPREVVHQFDEGSRHIEVAIELARLAGEEDRARKIDDVWARPYGRNPRELNSEDIKELLELIDGLELRLVGTVVDKDWRITADQVPDIRRRTKLLDLRESRGQAALSAVGEGMYSIVLLRNILTQALEEGLHVGVS